MLHGRKTVTLPRHVLFAILFSSDFLDERSIVNSAELSRDWSISEASIKSTQHRKCRTRVYAPTPGSCLVISLRQRGGRGTEGQGIDSREGQGCYRSLPRPDRLCPSSNKNRGFSDGQSWRSVKLSADLHLVPLPHKCSQASFTINCFALSSAGEGDLQVFLLPTSSAESNERSLRIEKTRPRHKYLRPLLPNKRPWKLFLNVK